MIRLRKKYRLLEAKFVAYVFERRGLGRTFLIAAGFENGVLGHILLDQTLDALIVAHG
jgi:hypothetical protein